MLQPLLEIVKGSRGKRGGQKAGMQRKLGRPGVSLSRLVDFLLLSCLAIYHSGGSGASFDGARMG